MHDDAKVDDLVKLQPCLETLCVAGDAFDDEAAAMVAQLTNLRHLDWESNPCLKDANSLTDAGLLELTALQGLTHLAVVGWTGGGLLLTGSLTSHSEVGD